MTALGLGHVSTGSAASDSIIYNYYEPAGVSYATSAAHSGITAVDETADHTACPAVASGYSSATLQPFTNGHNTAYLSYLCGPGLNRWYPNPSSGYLHGAVYNPNQSTTDFVSSSGWTWGG